LSRLLQYSPLQDWIDVGEKDVRRLSMRRGEVRIEVLKYIQSSRERARFVQVLVVAPRPVEGLARSDLHPARIDLSCRKPFEVLRGEVFAHYAHDLDR